MKICFLGNANSVHLEKWCKWFSEYGHEVSVISLVKGSIEGAEVFHVEKNVHKGWLSRKLEVFSLARAFRDRIAALEPDIVNAHYVTSYGRIAALTGIKDYVLSVWGTDVYVHPKKSFFHKQVFRYCLKKAGHLFSTSRAMADEMRKYTDKDITITPFGVDMELFSDQLKKSHEEFVIGTVKALDTKYGIDYLLKACALVREKRPDIPLRVRIAGKGPHEAALRDLAKSLSIDDIVTWVGFISQEQAAYEWANMDIGIVYSSCSESFGVAAVEAQSCGTPVIIADVPGLLEAAQPGESCMVVKQKDEKLLSEAIISLYDSPEKAREMGRKGRQYIKDHYEINYCFKEVEAYFRHILDQRER